MKPRTLASPLALAATAILLAAPAAARACSVCFGDPNSSMVSSAKSGIVFMLILIYALLMAMVGVAFTWWRRAQRLAEAEVAALTQPAEQSRAD